MNTKGLEITLADGTAYTLEFDGIGFVCGLCGTEYEGKPFGGYCDETYSCAMDDGESLIKVS